MGAHGLGVLMVSTGGPVPRNPSPGKWESSPASFAARSDSGNNSSGPPGHRGRGVAPSDPSGSRIPGASGTPWQFFLERP